LLDLLKGYREDGFEQLPKGFANRLLGWLSVQFLCAAVPVFDDSIQTADENGVMRDVEQVCLLAHGSFGSLLGTPAHGANAFGVLQSDRTRQAIVVVPRH
jgi:hypothetical protein